MKVIGTDLYDKGMDEAVREFITLAQEKPQNRMVSPSDANVLVHARRNADFAELLNRFFWNLPDGVPSVWILKLKGAKKANRISGPDFFKRIMVETKNLPINHYLCGGSEGTAKALAAKCQTWGNNRVVGYYSPPFKVLNEDDYAQMALDITQKETHVLWVGLGAPKQIYFAEEIRKHLNIQFIVTIGAAFDFHTGKVKKAPTWIQKIGMEWCYRLIQEPGRLGKRYLKVVPLFLGYNVVDLFKKRH